jgi:hypothetical protein
VRVSRLLAVGHQQFLPDPPLVLDITASPQGGSAVVNEPWAVYDAVVNKTYLAYVRGGNGNIEIVAYDHATHTVSSPTVLHSALVIDTHAAPSIALLASGHIVVAYTRHSTPPLYIRVSTNTHDISAFDAEHTESQGDTTYCDLVELTAEGKLYLFFRWFSSGTSTLTYISSTDGGNTWSGSVQVYAGPNVYWHIGNNGVDRIDFVATDMQPLPASAASLGHFYYTGGSYYKSDGTLISATRPFGFSAITKIIDGPTAGGGCFPFGISPIGPTVAVCVYLAGGTDNAYWDVRWTGSAWQATFITNAGGVFYGAQASGLSVDYAAPDHYVCVLNVSGSWQVFEYTTPDNGLTWVQGAQLTATSSPVNHVWTASVIHHTRELRTVVGISGVNR